ncbi:cupin-like domain-containing protein [Algibacillus agarilyticus]|uniref:cupin-like domain-containing protein n=1 Tax=Algibacillus agarilyticus TaxID=2234133 RepID=UPI001E559872|nr:cupin-like domain-containing protein [Algibacillus agarilyticus]
MNGYTPATLPAEWLNATEPFILKGFCAQWPLVKIGKKSAQAASDYLQQHNAGLPLKASYLEPAAEGRVYYNHDMSGFNFINKTLPLRDVLTDLWQQSTADTPQGIYMSSTNVAVNFADLLPQISVTHIPKNALINLWLGNQTRIAAHYDVAQNFACCLVGRRRFTLFPPDQVANLYPGPINFAPGGQAISTVDFNNPDLNQHPNFTNALASAQVAELEAGDALILPSMWWHHVEGLDDFNVLLTHWWQKAEAHLGRPTTALLNAILSIRDLPREQREAWRHLFEHYIFNHSSDSTQHIPEAAQSILKSPIDELTARQLRAELQHFLRR